ncbi:MAG: hypothetical protein GY752_09635 [bacterium]|nr:hypothetical protein [bacterium]
MHIVGGLRYEDGNVAVGFIPVSDANGLMTWTDPDSISTGSIFELYGDTTVRLDTSVVDITATNFVFGSPQLDYDGNTDHDSRMFFDKGKGAFRVGSAIGTNWDTDSLGNYSVAFGSNTKATGYESTAMGAFTEATGSNSTAMGYFAEATGRYSTAMGRSTEATGQSSTAMGRSTEATGHSSTAMGYETEATSSYSTAMGRSTEATGSYSTAMGSYTKAKSAYETALGRYNTDYTPNDATFWDAADRLFVIGNGTGGGARSDAMVVLKNGNTGFGTSNPAWNLHLSGANVRFRITDQNVADSDWDILAQTNGNTKLFRIWDPAVSKDRLVIDSTGKVGIGTYEPSRLLHVQGTGGVFRLDRDVSDPSISIHRFPTGDFSTPWKGFSIGVEATAADTGSFYIADFHQNTGGSSDKRLVIDNDGNVGIGTTTPSQKLHLYHTQGSGQIVNQMEGGALTRWSTTGTTPYIGTSNNYGFSIVTNNAYRLTADTLGNVGIGTTAPTNKLSVSVDYNSEAEAVRIFNANTGVNAGVGHIVSTAGNGDAFTRYYAGTSFSIGNDNSANVLKLVNGNNLAGTGGIAINTTGNVGIGTDSPSEALEVAGNAQFTGDDPELIFYEENYSESRKSSIQNVFEMGMWDPPLTEADQKMIFNVSNNSATGMTQVMTLVGNGRVGIGTSNPIKAKLQVEGYTNHNFYARYYNLAGASSTTTATRPLSAYFSDHVAMSQLQLFSDERIKKIEGVSNTQMDLETLMKMEITNYSFIDKIKNGDRAEKKVIAQQINEVYPLAVSYISDVIPNIYKLGKFNNGTIYVANDLVKGDKVQLILPSGDAELFEVLQASDSNFKIDLSIEEEEVFVYGKMVDDFHVVDYDAISMLNVSATQEQQKIIEALQTELNTMKAQNEALQTKVNEVDELKAKNAQMKTQVEKIDIIEAELAEIKAMLGMRASRQ